MRCGGSAGRRRRGGRGGGKTPYCFDANLGVLEARLRKDAVLYLADSGGEGLGEARKKGGQEVGWHSLGMLGGAEGAGGGRGGEGRGGRDCLLPRRQFWCVGGRSFRRCPDAYHHSSQFAHRLRGRIPVSKKGPRLSHCRGPGSEPRLALHSVNCGPHFEPTANKACEEQGDARSRKTERSQESRSHRRSSFERKRRTSQHQCRMPRSALPLDRSS